MFEDTKGVIWNHKSKDRQYIDQTKKDKKSEPGGWTQVSLMKMNHLHSNRGNFHIK